MKYFFLLLLFSFLCLGDLAAQVGINNPNPSQALDVGGKIKVGDDQIAPVAGTIRYNRVTGTFEGYDGTEWSVFNPEENNGGAGTLPSGTVVVSRVSLDFTPVNEPVYAAFKDPQSGTTFTEVPAGRTLFVSYVNVMPSSNSTSYFIEIYPENQAGTAQFSEGIGVIERNADRNQELTEDNGFILIIPAGKKLAISKTEGRAFVFLRGFLQ
ncbi:MAG: hypothetical protein AB8H12_06210 [Lewinella sp.]